jgi:hypothetical protein
VHFGVPAMRGEGKDAVFSRYRAGPQFGDHAPDVPPFEAAAKLLKPLRFAAEAVAQRVTHAAIEILPVTFAQIDLCGPAFEAQRSALDALPAHIL